MSSAPPAIGGAKLKRIFRAGSDQSGSLAARALSAIVYTEIATESTASHSQMKIQRVVLWVDRGEHRCPDGRQADDDRPPPRDRRERPGGLHRLADEPEVVHRPRLHLGRLGLGGAAARVSWAENVVVAGICQVLCITKW